MLMTKTVYLAIQLLSCKCVSKFLSCLVYNDNWPQSLPGDFGWKFELLLS